MKKLKLKNKLKRNSKHKLVYVISIVLGLFLCPSMVYGVCTGSFLNPITAVCWKCLFPISVGGLQMGSGLDAPNPSNPVCFCAKPAPIFIQVGVEVGFWEPFRTADVTKFSGCMVGLGGITIPMPNSARITSTNDEDGDNNTNRTASWQFHWYIFPAWKILGILKDIVSLNIDPVDNFSVAMVSELDPTWLDDSLSNVMTPEAVLFSNKVAQASCAADAVAASVGLPLDFMYWCAGAQGAMFPLSGNISTHIGDIQSTLLAVEKYTFHLHRDLILQSVQTEFGGPLLCMSHPEPIMRKSAYREQLAYPIPAKLMPHPYGQTTTIWEMGKSIPIKGENYAYLVWRKHNICAF